MVPSKFLTIAVSMEARIYATFAWIFTFICTALALGAESSTLDLQQQAFRLKV